MFASGRDKRFGSGAVFLAAVLGVCSATAQELLEPPAPVEASSALNNPEAVQGGPVPLRQSLPQGIPLAFYLSIGEVPVQGDWNVTGDVISVNADRVVLQTPENEQATLLYRLPGGAVLDVVEGETISIVRSVFPEQLSWGWVVDIRSGEAGTIASGGRLFGAQPQSAVFANGNLQISQSAEREGVLSESDYDTTYAIDVELDAEQLIDVVVGQPVSVQLGLQTLEVELLSSIESVPTQAFEDSAEGVNYALQFAATPLLPE